MTMFLGVEQLIKTLLRVVLSYTPIQNIPFLTGHRLDFCRETESTVFAQRRVYG